MMRRTLLLLVFFGSINIARAQVPPIPSEINPASEIDFGAESEEKALKTARYLLSVILNQSNRQHTRAIVFLQKWMIGTPNYTFDVLTVSKLTGRNEILMTVAFAAMVEYVLTHKDQKEKINTISAMGLRKAIAYAKRPIHKVKINADLNAVIEADKNGKLEQYVASKRKKE